MKKKYLYNYCPNLLYNNLLPVGIQFTQLYSRIAIEEEYNIDESKQDLMLEIPEYQIPKIKIFPSLEKHYCRCFSFRKVNEDI